MGPPFWQQPFFIYSRAYPLKMRAAALLGSVFVAISVTASAANLGYLTYTDQRPAHLAGSSFTKAVVLIHGYTQQDLQNTPANAFDASESPEWGSMIDALDSRVASDDTKVLLYHWEAEASTGISGVKNSWTGLWQTDFSNPAGAFDYACQAAGNAYYNQGPHLAALFQGLDQLREVTFIAHSAGSWVAREAIHELLLTHPFVVANLVLLDPFIPGADWTNSIHPELNVGLMSAIVGESYADRLYGFENDYAIDTLTDHFPFYQTRATSQFFALGGSGYFVVNNQVDYVSASSTKWYKAHAGPIQFYADTIFAEKYEGIPFLEGLFTSTGLKDAAPFWDYKLRGFFTGLFHDGLSYLATITAQPHSSADPAIYGTAASIAVTIDYDNSATYQWYRNGVPLIPSGTVSWSSSPTGSVLTFASVAESNAGTYVVGVRNALGWRFSAATELRVEYGWNDTITPTFTNTAQSTVTRTPVAPLGSPTNTPVPTLTRTPVIGAPVDQELLTNGDFENGSTGWTMAGPGVFSTYPHSGSGYAVLGELNSSVDVMYQTVTIPSFATSANLSFWYNIVSAETDAVAHESMMAVILDANGAFLASVATRSNLDKQSGPGNPYYVEKTFDLLPYRGRSIRIAFIASPDGTGSLLTSFKIDDVSLRIIAPAGTPTITPVAFSANLYWTRAVASAPFPGRQVPTCLDFAGKIWLIGGYDGLNRNDVWSSVDGFSWTEATSVAAFPGRNAHTSLVYNNKMWVIGGSDAGYRNDVWSSTDGVNWTQATANAAFAGRSGHTSLVFNNKMWVIGGYGPGYLNDVWSSTDGATWTLETGSAAFEGRDFHSSAVFNGRMWVIGGQSASSIHNADVWSSADGQTWVEETAAPGFEARFGHESFVFGGRLWVIAGKATHGVENDLWSSLDGRIWAKEPTPNLFGFKYRTCSVLHNGDVWLIGGLGANAYDNDIWYSTGMQAPPIPATSTPTPFPSVTQSETEVPFTSTVTLTSTFTSTRSPSSTVTPSGTSSCTPTRTATASPTCTLTASATHTGTASPSSSPSVTPSSTKTRTPTSTPTRTASGTASATSTASPTATVTPSPTISATFTSSPSVSPTFTASPTPDYLRSGPGKVVVGPVPAKVGSPVCLAFPARPISSEWTVFNISGEKVATLRFGSETKHCLSTTDMSPGIYFVKGSITSEAGVLEISQRIVLVP